MHTPVEIEAFLERTLLRVQKPARYTGGEINQVVKDWDKFRPKSPWSSPTCTTWACPTWDWQSCTSCSTGARMCWPSALTLPGPIWKLSCERPRMPLYSLETKHPLAAFDILGFTLPYETLYTNTLNILDLAGIPLFSADRNEQHPLVIAGGHAAYNPEPMHAFIDAFVIGEGEEVIEEIVDAYQAMEKVRRLAPGAACFHWRRSGVSMSPSLYQPQYHPDGTLSRLEPLFPGGALAGAQAHRR